MSWSELSQYRAYRNNIKRQLLIVGLWPNNNPSRLYCILPCIFFMLTLCTTFAIFGYVRAHFTNIALVTKGLSVMVSYLAVTLKVFGMNSHVYKSIFTKCVTPLCGSKMTCVIINRDEANQLHDNLDPHFSKLLSNSMSKLVLKGGTTLQCLSWTLTFVVGLSTLSYVAIPVISLIYQHSHHIQPIKYMLVYPTAYPWSINPPGFRYKIHFILESAASVALFCITVGIDSLFTMYGFQMVGQFREMSRRITNISNEVDKKNALRECVLQHQKMIKCRDILQKIYGPVILWIITTNAIILCSLIFQITQAKSIGRYIFFSAYIILKTVQTFMYAWTGTRLTTASADYREAVYASDWYGNKHFMTSILIILTQKPMMLTACNFSNVTLDLFIMVLNTTMSYFFLLRTLEDDS